MKPILRAVPFFTATLAALSLSSVNAQVLLDEQFTGGASTTGFTVVSDAESDCEWTFAPGDLTDLTFSVDGTGALPAGADFDGDFAFLDSDACGASGITVNSTLVSAPFDASTATYVTLTFSQQYHFLNESFAKVEAFNGATWTEVVTYENVDVGWPNPAITSTFNITDAVGGSPVAQLRFQFSSGWDWWWALDNIVVTGSSCIFPAGLAAVDPGNSGAMITFTENGSPGYEWVVTNGPVPDGTNAVASGTAPNTAASGLEPGTTYWVYVRSACSGGGYSDWSSGVSFMTDIINDECLNALTLTVNTDYECGSKRQGTVIGASGSNIETTCFGTADDDVWFKFVALATTHRVSLIDITGSTGDLYHALWSGDCTGLTLVPNSCSDPQESNPAALTVGETYYLQVYTWTDTPDQTSVFNVCIGTDPAIGITEEEAIATMRVFPNPVRDQLNIDQPGASVRRLLIVDAAGRKVREEVFQRTIDVSTIDAGAYSLFAFDRDARIVARSLFIKE